MYFRIEIEKACYGCWSNLIRAKAAAKDFSEMPMQCQKCIKRNEPYTPENLRAAIKRSGVPRKKFAEKFGMTKRSLDAYCLPFSSRGHIDIGAEKWIEIIEKEEKCTTTT